MRSILLIVIAVGIAGCATIDKGLMAVSDQVSSADPVTGERQINLVSAQKEISSAEESTTQILEEAKNSSVKLDADTKYYDQVIRVFDRLKLVVHRQDLPWEVHVLDTPDWNAFAIGGGKIFVFTGIFQDEAAIKTDNELAVVLAHEMAHVAARHSSEKGGKLALMKGASKKLKKEQGFDASFTTNQEDEADKYSALYLALAGYDPAVGETVWKRMHAAAGSYTGDMQYDHPLSDDRAENLKKYASIVSKYLVLGQINPDHQQILKSNDLYLFQEPSTAKAGEGGGLAALLETATNSYLEVAAAKNEEQKRKLKQIQQEQQAAQRMRFDGLKISNASEGGKGIFGISTNTTQLPIVQAVVALEYISNKTIVARDDIPWSQMQASETKEFGITLKDIQYDSISIRPVYVQLLGE